MRIRDPMVSLPDAPDGFKPTYIDLLIAAVAAIALPLIAGFLLGISGALIPLVLYYGVFSWGVVRWRRGAVGYEIRRGKLKEQFLGYVSPLFIAILILQVFLIGVQIITAQQVSPFNLIGFMITLMVWAPVNAFSEQLIWMYTFDSYAEFFKEGPKRIVMILIGGLLYLTLIGMIHVIFWIQILPEGLHIPLISEIYIIMQIVKPIGYIFLYRKAKSMWPLALLHISLNIVVVTMSGYSILPYLLLL